MGAKFFYKKGMLGPASMPHYYLAKALGATMWFWIFYRMKQDGGVLFGFRHPWEHPGHKEIKDGDHSHH